MSVPTCRHGDPYMIVVAGVVARVIAGVVTGVVARVITGVVARTVTRIVAGIIVGVVVVGVVIGAVFRSAVFTPSNLGIRLPNRNQLRVNLNPANKQMTREIFWWKIRDEISF
ncbi:hypothetical protein C2G38_2167441 [Gigaspora rosea]|uniref:Uncharacterized protein n=1 Tax=Gigaspora rosea TaxID=44941 RepID=A0A397VQR3_9GLOM|nr:hypothetical protein C2G38_2167441 [Gigaspora rosea]